MRFLSQGLVHAVARVWDIDGQTLTNCSARYLRSLGTLNIRGACGEQALWVKGFASVGITEEPLTCLACLVSA